MVVYGVLNGLVIGLSGILEVLMSKRDNKNLSIEEILLIDLFEELEQFFISQGKDPNLITKDEIDQYIQSNTHTQMPQDKDIRNKYSLFNQKIDELKKKNKPTGS